MIVVLSTQGELPPKPTTAAAFRVKRLTGWYDEAAGNVSPVKMDHSSENDTTILKKRIQSYFGRKVAIIDSAAACADHSAKFVASNSLSSSGRSVTEKYFVTDMPSSFYRQASRFLGRELDNFEKISL